MPAINETMTVGEIVARFPAVATALESFGIDYCCGGRKTLAEAVERKGLDLDRVVTGLEDAASGPIENERDWRNASLSELCDHIEATHHEYLRRELPALAGRLDRVVKAHGDRRPEMHEVAEVFRDFAAELNAHMLKEEQILFPAIRAVEAGQTIRGIGAPIAVMEQEHDDAGRALERMRELTGGYAVPMDACGTYRALLEGLRALEADMHRHVHKENNILFPRVLERLGRDEGAPACCCRP
ncbi:MAG TPA: iron-sulfur cluster repair di-iron protein [Phycisphaerales bacterium]|nr:iron-sulfur cluster repair di-iron protein [Phycisphaerales bacterium]